jgi:hypothetical protein
MVCCSKRYLFNSYRRPLDAYYLPKTLEIRVLRVFLKPPRIERLATSIRPRFWAFDPLFQQLVASRFLCFGSEFTLHSMLKTFFNQQPKQTLKEPIMFTTKTTAAFIATAIVAAHAAFGAASFNVLQDKADHAMLPVVKAERIVVLAKPVQIVKAERIEVTGKALQIVKAERIEVRAAA